ncbi:flagellar biosynthesis protein FlhA [Occultella aeris]|uniref:Flagellar biosynthesis protein FlhA n=1 Tax=Occultella aeris TaxID=2761496 RepID=A0A7M4DDF4_9MICO|nr:flagellar biosynthesis protein FlhA [Occultella aeris]VZO34873.1 Flagellar biosynthesis protein FlhA [Occultella aeris]
MNRNYARLVVPIFVVAIVLLLVVPVPAALLDVLFVVNIIGALVILLIAMYATKPLDFSVFPSLLLVATLLRLGLNVASTRLVLRDGYAGAIIETFGHIVVGGSMIIGAVIFCILVVIQFVVITKGAERVAEVGARFTLDAMPGKQMAIDADLNAGLITDEQARARRSEVAAEADFYGAMDGGSKFVKGDAIAGIIIIFINLIGGFAMGMLQRGMSAADALQTYSLLTIGDGLVSQIPALLMAVATGLIVTRSTADTDMGTAAGAQLTQSRSALMIAGGAAIALAIIPGMPKLPFVLIGGVLLLTAQRIKAREDAATRESARAEAVTQGAPRDETEDLIDAMRVHALEIMLAPDLVDLVSGSADDLLGRVRALRRKIAMELGVVIPPVRTRDSLELPAATYVVRIAGVEVGRGHAPAGKVLALGEDLGSLPGTPIVEPVFGLAGKWIPVELQHAAELAGATVIDRVSVLVTHLSALVTAHADRLLTREDVRVLVESVRTVSPSAVDELVPGVLSLAQVQQVLQGLLVEQAPINDLTRILEALTLRARASTDPEQLVEAARAAVAPALVARHTDGGLLRVVTIDPSLEQAMLEGLRPGEDGSQILLDPVQIDAALTSIGTEMAALEATGTEAVLVCAPQLRPAVRRLVAARTPKAAVLSYGEVTSASVAIETVGVVRGAATLTAGG